MKSKIIELSGIGDTLVNFVYSLAFFKARNVATSKRVSNDVLYRAVINSGLRDRIGSRKDKHEVADFAEGLIFYAWRKKIISIEECVEILVKNIDDEVEAFTNLLEMIRRRTGW
ncbi:MAG: hypothetical protein DRN25_01255 [Thermoplasmata archaeon]|nr:MAG: hypothetical protein DRN25_01255 [Thermoplasmata archaeon]